MDDIGRACFPGVEPVRYPSRRCTRREVDCAVARKTRPNITAGIKRLDREFVIFPPIVGDVQTAGLDLKSEVAEAVVTREPAVHETGTGGAAAQAFDEELAVRELELPYLRGLRNDNDVIDSTRTVAQRIFSRRNRGSDGDVVARSFYIDDDPLEPLLRVGFLDCLDRNLGGFRAVNPNRAVSVHNADRNIRRYVVLLFNRFLQRFDGERPVGSDERERAKKSKDLIHIAAPPSDRLSSRAVREDSSQAQPRPRGGQLHCRRSEHRLPEHRKAWHPAGGSDRSRPEFQARLPKGPRRSFAGKSFATYRNAGHRAPSGSRSPGCVGL